MISVRRMAGMVKERIDSQDVEIRSLRAKLKLERVTRRNAQAALRKKAESEFADLTKGIPVSGVDLGDGRPIRVTLTLEDGWFMVRRWKSRRVWAVPLSDATGVLARRAQVREVQARRGVTP